MESSSESNLLPSGLHVAQYRGFPDGCNPYQMSRPSKEQIVAKGRFYTAKPSGQYDGEATLRFLLTCEYLWVNTKLTIPLYSITEMGLTRKGGFVHYWNANANAVGTLYFTSIRWFLHRPAEVERFLQEITRQKDLLQKQNPSLFENIPSVESSESRVTSCMCCSSTDMETYLFPELVFVGLVPFAYLWELSEHSFVLCPAHAKEKAASMAVRNAIKGYWGFPGFLAAPWYVFRCILELRRKGVNDRATTLIILIQGIGVPLGLIAVLIAWLVHSAK